jgi:ferric-dicitrate binding protein FerR (iron transport regulator)
MLANEATIQELDEFNHLIEDNSKYKIFYENIRHKPKPYDFVTQYRANRSFDQIAPKLATHSVITSIIKANISSEEMEPNRVGPKKYLYFYVSIAASLLIVFFTWPLVFTSKQEQLSTAPHSEIATLKGQKSKITLPDGTQVWLNADSKIKYPEHFAADIREVNLEGEAYFDVAHNKEKPFIIHTKEMNIKVLGTAFNVRAYPNEKMSEAALIRGSIEVSFNNRPDQKLILKPNEKIEIKNSSTVFSKTIVNKEETKEAVIAINNISYTKSDSTIIETAWKNGKLIFDSQPFEQISDDMERWYDVKFVIHNELLKKKLFTANFNNETIEDVLHFLKLSYPFNYTYNKETRTITIN